MADNTAAESSSSASQVSSNEMESYVLSKVVNAHNGEVKSLSVTPSGTIISAGRDEAINFWSKKSGEYSNTLKLQQPKGLAVNSLAYAETENGWRCFAGRKDGSIAVYGSGSQEPIQIFKEHTNNVCCLHACEKNGVLLSGSWDTQVFVWPINDLTKSEFVALALHGHTLSVWALAAFPNRPDYYLSASADKTIRMWNRDETITVFKGHEDVVRALTVLSNEYFLSAGNDGNICYWSVEAGACIGKFKTKSHDFIYSMMLSDSHLLTTGEDGTLEFWNIDGSNENLKVASEVVLQTPASSTWDVKMLPSSDIVIAASDGRLYILTKHQSRAAPESIREAFDAEVVAKITTQMARKEESDTITIKVAVDDGPPKYELKYVKGSDPSIAAEKFIRDNGLPMSSLNEVVDYICENIPEARAAKFGTTKLQPGQKKMLDGVPYDFIFDVSKEDGTSLKLPYNLSETPEYAAQRFVEKHNLPVKFLQSISQLIRSETTAMASGTGSDFYDPFTGSGRYVPGGNSGNGSSSGFADPFTGSGRYVPGNSSTFNSTGFSGDPFTGDGGYRPSENSGSHAVPLSSMPVDKKKPRGPLVPVPEYYILGTAAGASTKAISKLKEFNAKQEAYQLNPEQISALEELLVVPTNSSYSSEIAQSAFCTALQWPISDVSPVLDFFRIGLLHSSLNNYFCSSTRGVELVGKFIAILVSEQADLAVRVFICRCIANAFSHPEGRNLFASTELSTLAQLVVAQLQTKNNMLQIASSTSLANWALALLQQSQECAQLGPREDMLRAIITGIESISFSDLCEDALTRLLQCIVTLMWGDSNVIKLAKNRNMALLAAKMKDAIISDSGKSIARDIVEMTYAV